MELEDIESALKRNWAVSDADIKVFVSGSEVTLNGNVGSLYGKDEAGRIAWNAPGVWAVNNNLKVEYYGRQIDKNERPVLSELM